jgi:hypothetical protein
VIITLGSRVIVLYLGLRRKAVGAFKARCLAPARVASVGVPPPTDLCLLVKKRRGDRYNVQPSTCGLFIYKDVDGVSGVPCLVEGVASLAHVYFVHVERASAS